jgi:hypothetical protein
MAKLRAKVPLDVLHALAASRLNQNTLMKSNLGKTNKINPLTASKAELQPASGRFKLIYPKFSESQPLLLVGWPACLSCTFRADRASLSPN